MKLWDFIVAAQDVQITSKAGLVQCPDSSEPSATEEGTDHVACYISCVQKSEQSLEFKVSWR